MVLFPWLFLILILALVAELLIVLPTAIRSLWAEHHIRLSRPSTRIVAALTLLELLLVLVWGLFLRQH